MFKVQIINLDQQLRYNTEHLEWVKSFACNLQNYYPSVHLNHLELIVSDNVIFLDADLYIYPISNTKIKVCFQTLENNNDLSVSNRPMHKVAITNHANTKADALSTFLLLLTGLTILPNGMGTYSSDLTDLMTALQLGRRAQLVNQNFFKEAQHSDILSLLLWSNGKGRFSSNLEFISDKIISKVKGKDVLAILNITNLVVLKATTLAAVVTN